MITSPTTTVITRLVRVIHPSITAAAWIARSSRAMMANRILVNP
ncbi:hypothetical protein [Devosia crocina]|nr:hypothetical protein [Devosia crocina]